MHISRSVSNLLRGTIAPAYCLPRHFLRALASIFLTVGLGTPSHGAEDAAALVSVRAGSLALTVNGQGRLTSLTLGAPTGQVLHPGEPSYLLRIKRYDQQDMLNPVKAESMEVPADQERIKLTYDHGIALVVDISAVSGGPSKQGGYVAMKLVDAWGIDQVERVSWGPWNTRLEGPVGEFFGVLRSGTHTLGCMSLEPNTDGAHGRDYTMSAYWLPAATGGTALQLEALDHTRKRPYGSMRSSEPVPGFTVLGSTVALYGAPHDEVLDVIEQVQLEQGLPHPTYEGQWNKRSLAMLRPGIWSNFDHRNREKTLKMVERFGGINLCGFHTMFGNWGHFEPDLKRYPKGLESIRELSAEARGKGIGLTFYTLTNFTRSRGMPEPFLSPVPDERLETYDFKDLLLQAEVDAEASTLVLNDVPGLEEALRHRGKCVVRIGNELILSEKVEQRGATRALLGCKRGYEFTRAAAHKKDAAVRVLFFAGYDNVYPGTLAMNEELARNIAAGARMGNFSKVTYDGHESCLETGHGAYAMNRTLQIVHQFNADREMLHTGSRISNYGCNMLSYLSWGEYDLHKGFRGTMLDYRIRRQLQLKRSLMPRKMGQHYPNHATAEDMHWLMGQAVGWDSGVEFHANADAMAKNPEHEAMYAAVRLWEKARLSGRVSDAQKMLLRQVDCVHVPDEQADGSWDFQLKRRWRHETVRLLPPGTVVIQPLEDSARVQPATVDIDWLHSPLVAATAALSDDVAVQAGKPASIRLQYPGPDHSGQDQQKLQYVLRLPADAPCGIESIKVQSGTRVYVIPANLQPGEYLSFPLDLPMAFVYGAGRRIVREVHIRHQNELPRVKRGEPFVVKIDVVADQTGQAPTCLFNFYTFQPVVKPNK